MTTSLDDIMKFVVISDIYFVDMKIGVTAKMDRRYSNTHNHIVKYRLYLNLDNLKYIYMYDAEVLKRALPNSQTVKMDHQNLPSNDLMQALSRLKIYTH